MYSLNTNTLSWPHANRDYSQKKLKLLLLTTAISNFPTFPNVQEFPLVPHKVRYGTNCWQWQMAVLPGQATIMLRTNSSVTQHPTQGSFFLASITSQNSACFLSSTLPFCDRRNSRIRSVELLIIWAALKCRDFHFCINFKKPESITMNGVVSISQFAISLKIISYLSNLLRLLNHSQMFLHL